MNVRLVMKKLRLHLDEMDVESFEISEQMKSGRGTVRGHLTVNTPCSGQCDTVADYTCDPDETCTNTKLGDYTCAGNYTCWNSCQGWTCVC